ncbi:MAG: radical SAM protein [Methanobrevibacter sp.]|nr:radical SAM protein [Methanobrevibacter sp.]
MELQKVRNKILKQNRIQFFISGSKKIYLYDAFSQNIYSIPESVMKFFNNPNNEIELNNPSKTEIEELCNHLLQWSGSIKETSTDECHVTINLSNKCNLNCSYCYRNKRNKSSLDIEQVKSILSYARKKYMPEAHELVCSMCLTSEPTLEIKKLKEIKDVFPGFEDENCFLTMWFMSNGTVITDDAIQLIKQAKISPFWISLDGPESIHNKHRFYENGKGSHKDVLENIEKLKQNGIKVRISCVLTRDYLKPHKLLEYFNTLGIDSIQMTPVRNGLDESLKKEDVDILKASYKEIFNELYINISNNDFSNVRILRDDIIMSTFLNLFKRTKQVYRCTWGQEIVIDSEGDMYPCLYVIDDKRFSLGNIKDGKNASEILVPISVNNRELCAKCWARFLCGGTCHYNSIVNGFTENGTDEIECNIRKFIITESIELMIKLIENGADFKGFIEVLMK